MEISSTQSANPGSAQVEALKKSIDVSERAVLKVIEGATEQSKQVSAQKTGIGSNINITG